MSYRRNTVERWPLLSAEQRAQQEAAQQQTQKDVVALERMMTQLLLPAAIGTVGERTMVSVPSETQNEKKLETPRRFVAKADYVAQPQTATVEEKAPTEPREKLLQILQKKGFTAAQIVQIFEALKDANYAPVKNAHQSSKHEKSEKKKKVSPFSKFRIGTELQFPQTQVVVADKKNSKPCKADVISKTEPTFPPTTEYFNDRKKNNNGAVKIPVTVMPSQEKRPVKEVVSAVPQPVEGIQEVADVYLFLSKGAVAEAAAGYAYLLHQNPEVRQEKLEKLIITQQAVNELRNQLKDYPGILNISVAQRDQKFVAEVAVRANADLKGLPISHNGVLVRIRFRQTIEEYQQQK